MPSHTLPSHFAVFCEQPLAAIRPAGWLQRWLEIQRHGLTGHLEVAGYPFDTRLWACKAIPYQHGAPWWPYEQTAYWVDGFTRCGYLTRDPFLTDKARRQVEYVLKHADKDGYLGPGSCKQPMPAGRWSHMIFFRALMAHFYATGDQRIIPALVKHYLGSPFDHSGHRDVCNIEIMCWLYGRTGNARLLTLAEDTWEKYQATGEDDDLSLRRAALAKDEPASCHGVTFCETVKQPAVLFMYTGNRRYLRDSLNGFRKIDRHHMLVDGAPSSTESLRGTTTLDAHETCDIADYTWSAGYMLLATGKAEFADKIERACFNACPGAVTKDFHQLQYFSSPNQVVLAENSCHTLASAGGKWMCYRPKPGTECCTGEVNRTMPNYAARMWLQRGCDPVAALYGPSQFSFTTGRTTVTLHEETSYPFGEEVDFRVELPGCTPQWPRLRRGELCAAPPRAENGSVRARASAASVKFRLWLRIPAWCTEASLELNGTRLRRTLRPGRFVSLERRFAHGDRIRLKLPMPLKLTRSDEGGVTVERGPLLFALPVEAEMTIDRSDPHQTKEFPAYSLHPRSPWNYALCLDENSLDRVEVVHRAPTLDPWSQPPLTLQVPARRVKGWRLRRTKVIDSIGGKLVDPARNKWQLYSYKKRGDFLLTPPLPDPATVRERLAAQEEMITLVPYGCTLLRVAVFPDGLVQ